MGNPTKVLRAKLDELGVEWTYADGTVRFTNGKRWFRAWAYNDDLLCVSMGYLTPEQAIAATVGPTLDQDLQQALNFMRIWISEDAHLGESTISYELERAEGLRNLDAIEQAIAATVGNRTDLSKRLREVSGLHAFAELFGFDWEDGSDWTWHDVACAMADAVDVATVGVGTCYYDPDDTGFTWWDENDEEHYEKYSASDECCSASCDKCGHTMMVGDEGWFDGWDEITEWTEEDGSEHKGYVLKPRFKHCPNCGKRVKED